MDRWRHALRRLFGGTPGQRFIHFHRDHNNGDPQTYWGTVLYFCIGFALVLAGLIFSLLPMVPGFVFGLVGLAMIAARWRRGAELLDRGELAVRQWVRRWRSSRRK